MPCGGLTPFLQNRSNNICIFNNISVNALWRANSISTKKRQKSATKKEYCVNALWRANSISTSTRGMVVTAGSIVSMPCGGLTPFLPF